MAWKWDGAKLDAALAKQVSICVEQKQTFFHGADSSGLVE